MLQMVTQQTIEKFYNDVVALGLKFPVAEISRRTGISKGQVSSVLKKNLEPSAKFLKKFYESFDIESGATPAQTSSIPLTGPTNITLQDYIDQQAQRINELRRDKEVLYSILNSSLARIADDQLLSIAYQKAWIEFEAEKEAQGDEKKKQEIIHRMNIRVDGIAQGEAAKNSHAETGTRRKD